MQLHMVTAERFFEFLSGILFAPPNNGMDCTVATLYVPNNESEQTDWEVNMEQILINLIAGALGGVGVGPTQPSGAMAGGSSPNTTQGVRGTQRDPPT
jgi:hypothetical protein